MVVLIEDNTLPKNIRINAERLYREGHEFIENFSKLENVIYRLMDYRDRAKDIFNNLDDKRESPRGIRAVGADTINKFLI